MESTIRIRDWFRFDERRRPEVEHYRQDLLNRVFQPFVLLGLLALGLGAWRALRDGQWIFALAYLLLYVTSSVFAVSLRRLSVQARSLALLGGLFAIATAAHLRLGLSGVGMLVMVAACGLTAILRGAKASLWAVGISVVIIGASAFAILRGYLVLVPDRLLTSLSANSWLSACVTFVAVTIGLIIPFQALSAKLAESLGSLETKTKELERSNERLRGEVERRQRAEKALRASELRYRGIFEATPVGIWEEDLSEVRTAIDELKGEGVEDVRSYVESHPEFVHRAAGLVRLCDVNQAAVQTHGAQSKDELLQSLHQIFVPESLEAFGEVIITLAEGSRLFEGETINQTLQGERVHMLLRAAFPEDEDANVLVTTMDITDRKLLEQSLAQAQKMEAIGTLAGGLAHDFNNLLMGIRGMVSLMMRHADNQHSFRDHLESIDHLVDNGASLTGQLLGFARGGKYDVQTTDVASLLHRSLSIFGRAKKEIRTREILSANLWTAKVDQNQIEQVLLNLFLNAWHAMPDGGELTVDAENVTLDAQAAESRRLRAGDYVCIAVRDTGTGMDEQTCARVFEPFFTTRELGRGTGLGLASAYGIIRNHGGGLAVESQPGEGTTFIIHLRASKDPVDQPDEQRAQIAKGNEAVLVIDDEKAVLQATQLMLEELGYRVLTARDGAEALRCFEESREDIAVVVLDMIMPDMSGPEVFARLRAAAKDLPVLLSSGYSQDEKADALLQQGVSGFLQKPFGLSTLSRKLREVLETKPS